MRVCKRHVVVSVALVCITLVGVLFYLVLTHRSHPPSKRIQRTVLIKIQSQSESQILEGLRLLSLYQPADELRVETEALAAYKNPDIRVQSLYLIGHYRDSRAGLVLNKYLDDPHPDVAEEAARGLHNVNNALGLPFEHVHSALSETEIEGNPMLFSKKRSSEDKFWIWFKQHSNELISMSGREFISLVGEEIHRVDSGLAIEVGPPDQRPREFIISADGVGSLVDTVNSICDAISEMPNWTVSRFRSRREPANIGFQFGQLKVDPERIRFIAIPNQTVVDLIIYAHWRTDPEEFSPDGPSFILLDRTIGELDVITGIGEINLLPLESAPDHSIQWSAFRETFDTLRAVDD